MDGDVPLDCPNKSLAQVAIDVDGLPVRGNTVDIDARTAKIVAVTRDCDTTLFPLPSGELSWELTRRPSGSTAALAGTSSLVARLLLDRTGTYEIRFTACPGGCVVPQHPQAQAATASVVLEAVDELALPPESEPVPPTGAPTSPTNVEDKCPTFADSLNAAWLTVRPWRGADDYELLEGVVSESRVASTDNDSNHHSMDVNVIVRPDPRHRRLLGRGQDKLEIEWERNFYPEGFGPSVATGSRRWATGSTTATTATRPRSIRPSSWRLIALVRSS